jgi:hypothetical protein
VSAFRKNSATSIHLQFSKKYLGNPGDVAEALFSTFRLITIILQGLCPLTFAFWPLTLVPTSNIQKAIKSQTNQIWVDYIPGYIIKGRLTVLVPALKYEYIFNVSVSQKRFPTQ